LRWIAADARDVARIDRAPERPRVYVQTVARGLRPWQRRVERRRLLALIRRGALVAIAAACLLQMGALASGRNGAGVWLAPAAVVAAFSLAFGLAHRTSPAAAARLLDRDLALGAAVSTALELENAREGAADPYGLGARALSDGRHAVAVSLAGARARLQARRGEVALLASLLAGLAGLLYAPSPRTGSPSRLAAPAKARTVAPSSRALRADNGLATNPNAGPSLRGFKQTPLEAPPLAAVQAGGATRSGGAIAGHSPGGVASGAPTGSVQPASRTLGQSGSVQGTDAASSTAAGAGSGSLPDGSAGPSGTNPSSAASGSKGGAGSTSVAPLPRRQPTASAPGGSSSGTAGRNGGHPQGGSGSSAPGSTPGTRPGEATPGGATAGTSSGGKGRGKGVVPELGGARGVLPLAPGYEAIPGSKAATAENASSTVGRGGGAGHSGQAIGGAASSGGGSGVPYVPPGGATVASIDRGVVLGYFASFARVNASGW
jgi:hypothetical protein